MTDKSDDAGAHGIVGAQVRAVRTRAGLSLRKLASLIGVSSATLSQVENGHTGLTVTRLTRIAQVLGVSVEEIMSVDPWADTPVEPPVEAGGPAVEPTEDWRLYKPLEFDPVLSAALHEFVAIGYHGATVRDIAARAGLSVSGIYHYYAGKQEMLLKILEFTMADLLWRAEATQVEGRDAVERFSLMVEHLALFHTHRAELGFVGAAEKRSLDAANSRTIATLRTNQQRLVDRQVEEAVRLGRFRAENAHERARAIVTMCTALPTWWRPEGQYSPEEIAEQYVTFALDLMLKPR